MVCEFGLSSREKDEMSNTTQLFTPEFATLSFVLNLAANPFLLVIGLTMLLTVFHWVDPKVEQLAGDALFVSYCISAILLLTMVSAYCYDYYGSAA